MLSGCTQIANFAEQRADLAAYRIIDSKQVAVRGESMPITIESIQDEAAIQARQNADRIDLGSDEFSTPTYVLSLADALAIAFTNNRDYLTRKEALYNQALSLTESRRDYHPIFDADGVYTWTRNESGHGSPDPTLVERFGDYNASGQISQLFFTGATMTLDFTHDYAKMFASNTPGSSSNQFSFSVVQPLLNGAGSLVALESLRQAERDMIYEVRSFLRFQQSFAISIANQYYQLLQSADELKNERNNLESAIQNRMLNESLAEAGRISELDADQARQQEFSARVRFNNAQADYSSSLDDFKFVLGVELDLDIGPDPQELDQLRKMGLVQPEMTLDEALDVALRERMDLKTLQNQVNDAERDLKIAKQDFLPNLDVSYSFTSSRSTEGKDSLRLDTSNRNEQIGLDLGLPLDWTIRRNRYRRSLIAFEQQQRDYDEGIDNIILEVRNNWRQLERQRLNYEVQLQSVKLAERRVESSRLLFSAGRATTRDLNDALDSLVSSQNDLTASLVSYTIQRLRFWNSIERLKINERGMWDEQENT